MYYPQTWQKSVLRVSLLLIATCIIGWYFDQLLLALLLASLSVLAVNYWHLFRLNRWLWHSKKMSPPEASGIWEQIYEGIYYNQRRNRNKRKDLGELLRRFREGSEALPDAAVVVDSSAAIVWCNRLARIELGLSWPGDAGRRLDNLIRHPDFVAFFHSGNYQEPIEVPSPTNAQKIFEYRIMPYGEKHLLLMARDTTRVSQLEQMRKDFVANVSHELRTPLTVLNGYLELLPNSEAMPAEFLQKAYGEMNEQTRRMQSLIEQLLILSRIEASGERVFEKVVDVPRVLQAIRSEADALNRNKGHQLRFEIDENLRVYGIETELRSAFSNLLFNAIHYTPDKGEITLSWQVDEGQARFAVKDNGDGIDAKHQSRLTERFYRVDKARSRKTGGSGLGLSIVKHVLNHHNSRLNINSTLGEGSEFSFRFSRELTVRTEAEPQAALAHE